MIAGCASAFSPQTTKVNPNLPIPQRLQALSDVSQIGLEWKSSKDERVQGYYIYRASAKNNKLVMLARVDDRYASHYVDTNLVPDTKYSYAISSFSTPDQRSPQSLRVDIKTKPRLNAVPFAQAISSLPRRVKIIWTPHPNISIVGYEVQKRYSSDGQWSKACDVRGRLSAECMDTGLEHGTTYEYRVYAKNKVGVFTKPSGVLVAKTKKLPPLVRGLGATTKKAKSIMLAWEMSPNDDIMYYNVYSSSMSMMFFSKIAKTKQTSYTDKVDENGITRYYKVTAVDKDGLESLQQETAVQGSTLSAPSATYITSVKTSSTGVKVFWKRAKRLGSTYTLYKNCDGKSSQIKNINDTYYFDKNVKKGMYCEYDVVVVDRYGLRSEHSSTVSAELK